MTNAPGKLSTTRLRFDVALSFPGEHRARVEKIAEALAVRLGQNRVLYDRWRGPEFARPNLDVYLTSLYHEESYLLVFFLCGEYRRRDWCGLEWRAGRDLLKQGYDERLMFLRLDDVDIPGLYSIDGYLDIRGVRDQEVAEAILARLTRLDLPAATRSGTVQRAFTSKLPIVDPFLIDREDQLAFLDQAWAEPGTNFVQIIAAGGTGKTALVNKWFRDHLSDAAVFGWSFYTHGAGPETGKRPPIRFLRRY